LEKLKNNKFPSVLQRIGFTGPIANMESEDSSLLVAETRTSIILLRAEVRGWHMAENGD
jgi:hypothetical protein